MVTLKTILQKTPLDILMRKRKNPVIAKITRANLMMDDNGLFVLFHGKAVDVHTHKTSKKSKGPYLQLAKLYYSEDGGVSNPKTFVWCDCADFTYRCETSLALRGSSAVINSNGSLPRVTNPTVVPRVCKHSLAFLEKASQQFRSKTEFPEANPKVSKSDRELVDHLRKPRHTKTNIRRMFPTYFQGLMPGTRF